MKLCTVPPHYRRKSSESAESGRAFQVFVWDGGWYNVILGVCRTHPAIHKTKVNNERRKMCSQLINFILVGWLVGCFED